MVNNATSGGLLIAPEGIEIKFTIPTIPCGICLLIAPEGIEIQKKNNSSMIRYHS